VCSGDCVLEPVVLNTDDNAHIEFSAPHDLIGVGDHDGTIDQFYDPSWPWGRLPGHLANAPSPAAMLDLVHALLRRGRLVEANAFLSQMGGGDAERLQAISDHLNSDLDVSSMRFGQPRPNPRHPAKAHDDLLLAVAEVDQMIQAGDVSAARQNMEDPLGLMVNHGGPSLRARYAMLLFLINEIDPEVSAILMEVIAEEEAYVAAHPDVFLLLARSQAAAGFFEHAVPNLERYLDTQAVPPSPP